MSEIEKDKKILTVLLTSTINAPEDERSLSPEETIALGNVLSILKRIEKKLKEIPSDEQIEKSPNPNYARAYFQGKFDVLMDLINNKQNK